MPILLDKKGTYQLFCLNGHGREEDASTMVSVEVASLALRCYYCTVCSYVEMYMPQPAPALEPAHQSQK